TYTAPFVARIAIPVGIWSSPLPEPGLPKVLTGLNKDAHAVVAPGATPSTQTAKTTPATRAGSRRTRYLPRKGAGLVLSPTRSETRDGFIEILLCSSVAGRWTVAWTDMSVFPSSPMLALVKDNSEEFARAPELTDVALSPRYENTTGADQTFQSVLRRRTRRDPELS